MKAVDLFCGAGGLTRGLLDAGIDVVCGIDHDADVGETYARNNRDVAFDQCDIRSVNPKRISRMLGKSGQRLVAGCAPCQSFSKQRAYGYTRGQDATLLGAFERIVADVRPNHVIMENVPGVQKVRGRSSLARFRSMLRAFGYRYVDGVINAADYGVPQHRRRFVLIASTVGTPVMPRKTHGTDRAPHETVRGWIAKYPPLGAGEEHSQVPNHVAAWLSPRNLERISATPKDGGDRRAWPNALVLECHRASKGFSDVYGRMWWDRVAPTLTTKCHSLSNGRFGHPEQDRSMSLREAASLQTFPDDYVFFGTRIQIARQIGNAVPVRLGAALGKAVLDCARRG